MSSSISSSDQARAWRRFWCLLVSVGFGVAAGLYAFVVIVDPWDALPLSPRLPRVPISSNARFSFPALARSRAFDAALFGTSTARLIRPADLDPAFHARFVNLAMNSATAWEQTQLLAVFLRAHPAAKAVVIDMDAAWCGPSAERLTPRPFPEWMYRDNRWPGYREMLTPYAVQEAANQALVMLGVKRQRYGSDGYTSFVPPEQAYDPARVDQAFARWPATDETPVAADAPVVLPALSLLGPALARIPAGTKVVLFFPPVHVAQQGKEGGATAARWAACKREVAAIAADHLPGGVTVLDMLIPSGITRDRSHYWDPLHYRVGVAGRIAAVLGGGTGPEVRVLGGRGADQP
jgi:hypothetical protein